MKQRSLGTTLLTLAAALALTVYFAVQAVNYFGDPLTTTVTYLYQVEESVSLSGYVIREEQVLPSENSGLLQLLREEGERVSAGGAVANLYADQTSLDRQEEIAALDRSLEQLEYAKEAALGAEAVQKLDVQIRRSLVEYRSALAADRYRDAEKEGSSLRAQILKRDYSSAGTEDLDARIAELQSQLKTLRAQSSGSVRRITAGTSGLYSAVVDGYETVLTPDKLESLTPSALSAVKADSGTASNVGKLVLGKTWYYAAAVSTETAERLQKAEQQGSLQLRFAKGVDRDLPVQLASVGAEENGRVVVVLEGGEYLAQLTLLRQQSAQVICGSVEGLRVPKEALRIVTRTDTAEDGTETETRTTGVYCVVGLEAAFKPVKTLYTGEHFVLVEADPPADRETQRLRAGEEIIVTARDLYDGKVVR